MSRTGPFGGARRVLAAIGIGLAIGMMAYAPSAMADEETPPTAAEEYGFVDGWTFAKAHATVNTLGLLPHQARQAILDAETINQAGFHPDASTGFKFRKPPALLWPLATKDIMVDGPPGFVGSTTAVPVCPFDLFMQGRDGNCSPLSQVGIGVATVVAGDENGATPAGTEITSGSPIVKLPPPPDAPARFGYRTGAGQVLLITPRLRSDGDYGLRLRVDNLFTNFGILDSVSTLWGNPYDPIHDSQRFGGGIPASATRKPFLTNPTYCDSGPLERTIHARSWKWLEWTSVKIFGEQAPDGCDKLEFGTLKAPVSLTLQPDVRRAGSPAGIEARLRLPFNEDPYGLARPSLRDTDVSVAEGLVLNPSAAAGLAACSEPEIGLKSLEQPSCPDASKLATIKVVTPLLAEPLDGTMFLAEQDKNPFNSTMAMYLHVTGQGIQAKISGRVDRDPLTGQVTTTFRDSPQLPFTDMDIRFKSGDRAALVTPSTCGEFTTRSTLNPWSAPHSGPPAKEEDSFTVTQGCVSDPSQLSFKPTMAGGVENPTAGESSTFVLKFDRPDGDQELEGLRNIRIPEGLVGNVGSVELCPDADADRGSCGAGSRIGRVQASVGAGRTPMWVPQAGKDPTRVHLTGPYRGAPFGLSVVVPAQAGPFDLGKVVVRSALHVDERTAQVTSGVDETRIYDRKGNLASVTEGSLPRILEGVFLRQREIRVLIDQPGFMVNPTSCEEKQITAGLAGFEGAKATVSERFQVGDCASLGFAPRFTARILDKGRRSTLRSWHPRTRFTVVPRKGDANIGGARVALPSSTILDQGNIGTTCTRAQMAARACPAKSVVGYAKAWSPVLRKTVEGPVYLAANGGVRPLPDIAAVLDGEVRVVLQGEVSTLRAGGKARLQNTFRIVPDAPVTRFELTMRGGKNTGLLVNSTDLCRSRERGMAVFNGQNGRQAKQNLRIGMTFKGCNKVRRQAARKAAARKKVARQVARRAAVARRAG